MTRYQVSGVRSQEASKQILLSSLSLAVLLAPASAFAAARNFSELAATIVNILNTGTGVLILLGLVTYFWGVASNIPHFGDEKGAEKMKAYFFWGIIVLFVMVSIWGIVQILQNTLFGGAPFHPTTGEPVNSLCAGFGNC